MKLKLSQEPLVFSVLLKKIVESDNADQIMDYENQVYASIISPILISAAFANILLGVLCKEAFLKILIFFVLFILFGNGINHSSRSNWNYKIKIHISGVLTLLAFISFVHYYYYYRIGLLAWFFVCIISILSILRVDKRLLFYNLLEYFVLFSYLYTKKMNKVMYFDNYFYMVLIVVTIFILCIILAINKLYYHLLRRKIDRFNELIKRKEEITVLYKEIAAAEKELRLQNEQLNSYNAEIKANEERLKFLAYNDSLTELPNSKMIVEQLELAVDENSKNKTTFSIAFIDLDKFKIVNDTLGHSFGDRLLFETADRMKRVIDEKDILGRLGGDELVLIIRRELREDILFTYVQKICDIFYEPFYICDKTVEISASFGIAIFPRDAQNASELLKAADTAMYKAKELGRNNVQFYHEEMRAKVLNKIDMERRLVNAISRDELFLEYQPQFFTDTRMLCGFEALLRWEIPEKGRVSPVEFIPLAEEMGIIHQIGEWVIQQACAKIKELQRVCGKVVPISVNVSTVQMRNSEFVNNVKRIIETEGVDPSYLKLEITESIFIDNMEQAIAMLIQLKEIGIKIALDDFGTGYSSLFYLTKLPIDILKLDKSFIDLINSENAKYEIMGGVIALVHKMDIVVIAEGVETDFQMNYLQKEHCDIVQGFLLGRPLNDKQMELLIRETQL